MAIKTRKATEVEFNAYAAYMAPRQREYYNLLLARKSDEAHVVRQEMDTYCFENKIVLKRSGVHIKL